MFLGNVQQKCLEVKKDEQSPMPTFKERHSVLDFYLRNWQCELRMPSLPWGKTSFRGGIQAYFEGKEVS